MIARLVFAAALALVGGHAFAAAPDALVIAVADEHSAYDRLPTLVALVDQVRAENPGVPLITVIDGDAFEYGNRVARRTAGKLDLETLRALAQRGPTVLNIGNHETDLFSMTDLIDRVRATGVTVIGGNARSRETGKPFAPASVKVALGSRTATIIGFTTDALATYRVAIRPTLDLDNPVAWARAHAASELAGAEVPIVLSHAGLRSDREILPLVPVGTLFIGGHDHLQLVQQTAAVTYVHTGSWLASATVAELRLVDRHPAWTVRAVTFGADSPRDAALSRSVETTVAQALTDEDKRVIGHRATALSAPSAARFAVECARRAGGGDLAIVGATTFGDGLPQGDVIAYALDNCVRFDGPLYAATVDGATVVRWWRKLNQGPDTPFGERLGENLIACGTEPREATRMYRVVTTDWIGKNPARFLGEGAPKFTEIEGITLKAAVIQGLNRD